ncbi:MAG: SDR family oxidoreductase [Clostridia bacterium]|nr:SDR family oxidoreductase [Clostridia bacterium]
MLLKRNKVAVITGASSSMGRVVIKQFREENIDVIAITRDKSKFERMLEQDGTALEGINIVETDVMDFEGTKERLEAAIAQCGNRANILVNAMGKFHSKPMLETSMEDFQAALNDNLLAIFSITKVVLPYMVMQRNGSIVNVSSILGFKALQNASCVAYGAAKAGLIQMTKLLAVEVAPFNIRVNCVCPGILNPVDDKYDGNNYVELHMVKNFLSMQPIKRFGNATEIAAAITFLAGEKSAWTTGAVLTVDGGMVL